MASAAHHAASLDLKLAIPDVAYTIIFLSGIAFTSTWADFAIPRICSIFSPDASVRSTHPSLLPSPSPSTSHALPFFAWCCLHHQHPKPQAHTPILGSTPL